MALLERHTSDWSYLLTENQTKICHDYMGMWQRECGTDPAQDESCLFNLCQDPWKTEIMDILRIRLLRFADVAI